MKAKMISLTGESMIFLESKRLNGESYDKTFRRICGLPENIMRKAKIIIRKSRINSAYDKFKALAVGETYVHTFPVRPGATLAWDVDHKKQTAFLAMKSRWIRIHGWKVQEWSGGGGLWCIKRLK